MRSSVRKTRLTTPRFMGHVYSARDDRSRPLPAHPHSSPDDLFPSCVCCHAGMRSLPRCRHAVEQWKRVAASRCLLRNVNRIPFLALPRLGPTNSGTVYVAQKPYSSSAPRITTWINATSIRICNSAPSTPTHIDAFLSAPRPPTPCRLYKCPLSVALCAPFIFEALVFGRGVLTHSLADAYF